jgi:DNA mismatch repair ATPase MutS
MDEVGRGTTVRDGLAIAFASLHHIATVTKSRCLFATHFHELAEMLGNTTMKEGLVSFLMFDFIAATWMTLGYVTLVFDERRMMLKMND